MFVVSQDFVIRSVVEQFKCFDTLLNSTNVFSKPGSVAPTCNALESLPEGYEDRLSQTLSRTICEIASQSINLFVPDAKRHDSLEAIYNHYICI